MFKKLQRGLNRWLDHALSRHARTRVSASVARDKRPAPAVGRETLAPTPPAARAAEHIARAQRLEAERDFAGAAAAWQQALDAEPNDGTALLGLARSTLNNGDPQAVVELLTDRATVRGRWRMLGHAHVELEEPESAIRCYEEALEEDEQDVNSLIGLGVAYADAGRQDESTARLERAIELEPANAMARFNLALSRFEDRRDAEAQTLVEGCRMENHGPPWLSTLPDCEAAAQRPALEWLARHKLRHDVEQLEHLRALGKTPEAIDAIIADYRAALAMQPAVAPNGLELVAASAVAPSVAATYLRPALLPDCPALEGPAVNPSLDREATEARYFASDPSVTQVDEFLTQEALSALRDFCLDAGFWHDVKAGYLGAYMYDGFCSGLLLQIARELRDRIPGILGTLPLQIIWGYKYDSQLEGIGTHADQAAVNVNFWITPDEANLDPNGGGLVVYSHRPPENWSFRRFNSDEEAAERYLASVDSPSLKIAHRANRAVIFDSALFHRTDDFRFRDGYADRRINVTFLYGRRRAC